MSENGELRFYRDYIKSKKFREQIKCYYQTKDREESKQLINGLNANIIEDLEARLKNEMPKQRSRSEFSLTITCLSSLLLMTTLDNGNYKLALTFASTGVVSAGMYGYYHSFEKIENSLKKLRTSLITNPRFIYNLLNRYKEH